MSGKMKHIFLMLLIISSLTISAQKGQKQKITLDYIEKYKNIAMCEMVKNKIPASITLAQGILESGNGTGKLAREGRNHFGIKCHEDWKGRTMRMDDDAPKECFRVYKKVEDSYRDHSKFLMENPRYASLFELEITDYKGWARGLKKAGYATAVYYDAALIQLIEDYDLQQYDQLVVNKKFKCKRKDRKNNEPKVEEPKPEEPKTEKPKKERNNVQHEVVAAVPVLAECPVVGMTPDHHYIRENFGVKFVITKEGDDLKTLAKELRLSEKQLIKYNDLGNQTTFGEGEILYIGQKRRRAAQGYEYHQIKQGETLRQVSRLYAVRLDRLFKMNGLDENSILQIGQEIKLR